MTREEAIIDLNALKFILDNDQYTDEIEEALDTAISALQQPEIVRCKDCKHYLNSSEKCALIDTRLHFYETNKTLSNDSFCSWAERKEGEANG